MSAPASPSLSPAALDVIEDTGQHGTGRLEMAATREQRETVPPDARCVFTECPASGDSVRCPDGPVYRVWIEGCRQCATWSLVPMECVGHWACVRHGAEVRGGELDGTEGEPLEVARIRSL